MSSYHLTSFFILIERENVMLEFLTCFEMVLFYRMLLAAGCGLAVGYERKYHLKSAGVKTHVIVSLASALMMEVSKYGFTDIVAGDGSRIAAQVVSGISFLGAGIIIKRNQNVEGLTTAAGIWMMSGIGLAVGAGMYGIGCSCTVLYILLNFGIRYLEKKHKTYQETYVIQLESVKVVRKIISESNMGKIRESFVKKEDGTFFTVEMTVVFSCKSDREEWKLKVLADPDVKGFEIRG